MAFSKWGCREAPEKWDFSHLAGELERHLSTCHTPLLGEAFMLAAALANAHCGGADSDESLVSSADESTGFSRPLLPKSGMDGLPLASNAATRSRLLAMAEAGPSDSDSDGSGGVPVGLYTTLAVLILLATANQWSRAIIFYIVDFSNGAQAQPEQFINVALGFDEASNGLI